MQEKITGLYIRVCVPKCFCAIRREIILLQFSPLTPLPSCQLRLEFQ